MRQQIAYVEDDEVILENYTELLREEGFDVMPFSDKQSALAAFAEKLPDLVLLDVTMHGERDAGFHICSELRRLSSDLPVIFLTSHDAELEKISGLRVGADDYITKDASIDYIVVRIEALFRRLNAVRDAVHNDASASDRVLGELRVDDALSCVFWKGQKVNLSLTHYWIVRALSANPGEVKSHRDLMKACSLVVENNTITAHVRAIRNAFIALDENFNSIKTERGRGYRWVA